MKTFFTTLALATFALAAPRPQAETVTPPAFSIKNVVSGGSGCPQGSVDIKWTDSKILPIHYGKDFQASIGPNVAISELRKFCQVNIQLQFSPGFQYTVLSADYTGWAALETGLKGYVNADYYFSGSTEQATTSLVIGGPFWGKYSKHDEVALPIWSPCGSEAALNINADVSLTPFGGGRAGTIAATREGIRLTNQLYFVWRKC